MPLVLITPPTEEPITLEEAKEHLRLEHSLDDGYVSALIQAARQYVEEVCWRGLVTQTWELILDGFPECGRVELPRGNLASVESVSYVDPAGAQQMLAASEYVADSASVPGRIVLAHGRAWPSTRCQWDAVRVRYTVGWVPADVPRPVKHALLLLVSQMYEHRTPEVFGALSKVDFAVDALIAPYRLVRW